jgi:hypothetical protein
MIPRTTIGDNYQGAVNYQFTGRLNSPSDKQPLILFAAGVRTDNAQVMGADFEWGCTLNPNVSKPVWHTSISFNPDDTEKLTNEKMLAVAQDFRQEMGLLGTQCVIFRHFDKEDNQHLHILVNRVADDGHSIPDGRNFYRSKLAVAKLCEKHGLTPAAGQRPELQHPERIIGAHDKAGAEIRQALAYGLRTASERKQLWQELQKKEITVNETSRGVTFTKDGFTFSGSQIAKGYSLGGIDQQLATNRAAQALREEQRQAEARENERVRLQAQHVLTGLVNQKAFASHAEFRGKVVAQGYTFVVSPAGEAQLRHEASERQFDLAQVQPGGSAARPFWEQVDAVVLERARQVARREEARRETEQVLTQTRDSGLSRPEQFFYRLRAQPYDLVYDLQTRELTHVRHRNSGELFAYAEVQPDGLGAPPLAEQLATAVQTEQQQVMARRQMAASRDWAHGRALVENVTTQVQNAQQFSDRDELATQLKLQGVTLLPPPAAGKTQQFRLDATGQLFREKEVLRSGSLAEMLASADERRVTRRQAAFDQTSQDIRQTLHAPETPLTSIPDYQQQLEARGYKFWQESGKAMKIEHLASGEQFEIREVQPGGLTAPSLAKQVRDVLDQQKLQREIEAKPTKDLEQVLAAKAFATWSQFEAQVQAKGYQFVMGLDGRACLLHKESRQLSVLAKLQLNGGDLTTQVNEIVAAQPAEQVLGRIEVLSTPERSAAQRAANMQTQLKAVGVQVNVTPLPASEVEGSIVLTYIHTVKGAQLDQVNEMLTAIQRSQGVTVREQDQGFGQFPAEWPVRRGEYTQATLVFADEAAQQAAASGESAREQLRQTGAVVRAIPGATAGSLVLEVEYHTQRTDVKTLTRLLDQWQQEGPGIQVQETARARQSRGGQASAAETTSQFEL